MVRTIADFRSALGLAVEIHSVRFATEEGENLELSFLDHRTYGNGARLFIAKKGDKVVATSALLFQEFPEDLLRTGDAPKVPEEVLFWIKEKSREKVLEVSMFAAVPEVRVDPTVLRTLMAYQFLYWRALPEAIRPRYWVITVSPTKANLYRHFGFTMLGPDWKYGGGRAAQTMVFDTRDPKSIHRAERHFFKNFDAETLKKVETQIASEWIPWTPEELSQQFQEIIEEFRTTPHQSF